MRTKWKSRRRRLSRLVGFMMVSILAVALIVTVPFAVGTAHAAPTLDLEGTKTLRVEVKEMKVEGAGETANAEMPDVVIDLYKVANAVKTDGYDTYSFESLFDGLDFNVALEDGEDRETNYTEVWKSLGQDAAKRVFDAANPVEANPKEKAPNADIQLDSGLYLMIIRGKDLTKEEYLVREKMSAEDDEGNGDSDTEIISTIAYSDNYTFTYSPQLVALPTKEGDGIIATSNPGEWVNSLTLEPKVAISERFADLRIDKELISYLTGSPATFVFQVEATLPGDTVNTVKTVYSNAVSLTFDGPGKQSVWIEGRIPVGAEVTVTEVYSGVTYRPVGKMEQTLTLNGIRKDEAGFNNIASFRNEYDGTGRKGSAITNHFTYEKDDGWVLEQIPAATE